MEPKYSYFPDETETWTKLVNDFVNTRQNYVRGGVGSRFESPIAKDSFDDTFFGSQLELREKYKQTVPSEKTPKTPLHFEYSRAVCKRAGGYGTTKRTHYAEQFCKEEILSHKIIKIMNSSRSVPSL